MSKFIELGSFTKVALSLVVHQDASHFKEGIIAVIGGTTARKPLIKELAELFKAVVVFIEAHFAQFGHFAPLRK